MNKITLNDFDIKKLQYLGGGAFGKVYKVEIGGENYALKIFAKFHRFNFNEIKTMKLFSKTKNIIDFILDLTNQTKQAYLMEFAPYGTLESYRKKNENNLTKEEKIELMKQVVNGIKSVHSTFRIIHDVKEENILVCKNKIAKLCDLGLASVVSPLEKNAFASDIYYLGYIFNEFGFSDFYHKCQCDDISLRPNIQEIASWFDNILLKTEKKKPKLPKIIQKSPLSIKRKNFAFRFQSQNFRKSSDFPQNVKFSSFFSGRNVDPNFRSRNNQKNSHFEKINKTSVFKDKKQFRKIGKTLSSSPNSRKIRKKMNERRNTLLTLSNDLNLPKLKKIE
ncbi:serine/threonine-protein kinase plk1 [Anaeramoeba ignava]|uniref:Serine/threonine-protein kinase plk1 n=1 Tax=Anaeramoeba ignava TaxID=1746090 RepID=A0A9Q0R6F2_ANAIG|nr:serine/threonine-protein kinase plk1 [Anaeramoeba ignava]